MQTTTTPAHIPSVPITAERLRMRRRSGDPTASAPERLFNDTGAWRASLTWRIVDYVPDAAAEIDAVVWELIAAGERDHARLYWGTVTQLRRLKRQVLARRQREAPLVNAEQLPPVGDHSDAVVDRVAARQMLAAVPPPPEGAAAWVARMTTDSDASRCLTSQAKSAGWRWARRTRQQIAVML